MDFHTEYVAELPLSHMNIRYFFCQYLLIFSTPLSVQKAYGCIIPINQND